MQLPYKGGKNYKYIENKKTERLFVDGVPYYSFRCILRIFNGTTHMNILFSEEKCIFI